MARSIERCSLPVLNLTDSPSQLRLPVSSRPKAGLKVLLDRKKSVHALVAATGLSTGRLNKEQSAFLMGHADVWGINQAFLHHYLVPSFYNVEMRTVVDHRDAKGTKGCRKLPSGKSECGFRKAVRSALVWEQFDATKRAAYRDTVFLCKSEHVREVGEVLRNGAQCPHAIVTYRIKNAVTTCNKESKSRMMTILRTSLRPANSYVREFCSSSLSRVVDLIVRMRYSTLSFVGVDLNSQYHFYTALPSYADVKRRMPEAYEDSIVAFVRRMNQNTTQHATAARGIHRFLDVLGMVAKGRLALFNLSPESMLRSNLHVTTTSVPSEVGKLDTWWHKHHADTDRKHRHARKMLLQLRQYS